jgi:ketosteroid isomerase-like protein
VQGQPALRAFFAKGFGARSGELRHVTKIDHAELTAADLAVADGQVLIQQRTADGSWQTVREFANTSVAVRQGGRWKVSAIRGYPVEKTAAR